MRREAFGDDAQFGDYVRLIQERLPRTLLICFGLGLIPVVGVVPGMVYYRFQLVNPLRRYVPFGSAMLAKWLGRFACFAVLGVQWIPLIGGVSLPIMASINYAIYRRAIQAAWRRQQRQLASSSAARVPIGDATARPVPHPSRHVQ